MTLALRHKTLISQGDQLFGKRSSLMSFWQEVADNFYPERADFTTNRHLGEDFASNLDTSYPILARRDLGNSFNAMLRHGEWFEIKAKDEDDEDDAANEWLERATKIQRRAMYDRSTQFTRATKEGDHDYAAFGQCVISKEIFNSPVEGPHLLYRTWHLRDVAWGETVDGRALPVHRKWKPTALDIKTQFPKTAHANVHLAISGGEPFKTFECRHIIVRADEYESPEGQKWRTPYVSIYLDVENECLLEEKGAWTPVYTIPRWQTVSGSQYAYSPATVAALPDARLLQSVTYTLLTAGEMAVQPAMIGVQEAMRSDMNVFPGGFTAIDAEYDERLGEVLRPLNIDTRGIPLGFEMASDTRSMLAEAFFLNRLNLPQSTGEMTAYEVGQRVQEYIRNALPLFEPMENDYNASLCEDTFELLMRGGAFGSPFDMPESLRGADVEFQFVSPIKEAEDQKKGDVLLRSLQLVEAVAPLDPMAPAIMDGRTALRDALDGIGQPARWRRGEQEVNDIEVSQQEAAAREQMMATMQQGAEVAKNMGDAGASMKAAGVDLEGVA